MRPSPLLVLLSTIVHSCSQPVEAELNKPDSKFSERPSCGPIENFYFFADTVYKHNDSLFVVNHRLDTAVVETGIFTYLQTSYPVSTPDKLVQLMKLAVRAEKARKFPQATNYYQAAINFYQDDWTKQKTGFEDGGFSDLNDYYAANVNVTILVSYALEKLGHLPEARAALSPFLANVEAENSDIQLRYIQLCIRQFGKAATKQALNISGKTVHRSSSENSPQGDWWRVNLFGADLGVADFNTDTLTPSGAQAIISKQPFYALTK